MINDIPMQVWKMAGDHYYCRETLAWTSKRRENAESAGSESYNSGTYTSGQNSDSNNIIGHNNCMKFENRIVIGADSILNE